MTIGQACLRAFAGPKIIEVMGRPCQMPHIHKQGGIWLCIGDGYLGTGATPRMAWLFWVQNRERAKLHEYMADHPFFDSIALQNWQKDLKSSTVGGEFYARLREKLGI